jgi:hypothetical protein
VTVRVRHSGGAEGPGIVLHGQSVADDNEAITGGDRSSREQCRHQGVKRERERIPEKAQCFADCSTKAANSKSLGMSTPRGSRHAHDNDEQRQTIGRAVLPIR